MDLSFWLTTVSVLVLVYAGGTWFYGAYVAPRRAAPRAASVKTSRRSPRFKRRSARSNPVNAVNAGSAHQDAGSERSPVQSVQDSSTTIAAPAGAHVAPAGAGPEPDGGFTLTARELAQLAEALQLRREGATVEAAVSRAFGVTKGATRGWKRAKALFDAATVVPGAAPAGTYAAAPTRPQKRRRAVGRA